MWIRTENGEQNKPLEFERSGSNVILRRNFTLISETSDFPAHWEYDEWQMTAKEYDIYAAIKASSENSVAPSEGGMTATENYTAGAMILAGGDLYKAVRNIPKGAKIVPNLNAIKTNLANAISESK